MITFKTTMGGLSVSVGGGSFGHIDKEGFFISPIDPRSFMRLSIEDLETLIRKITEYRGGIVHGRS